MLACRADFHLTCLRSDDIFVSQKRVLDDISNQLSPEEKKQKSEAGRKGGEQGQNFVKRFFVVCVVYFLSWTNEKIAKTFKGTLSRWFVDKWGRKTRDFLAKNADSEEDDWWELVKDQPRQGRPGKLSEKELKRLKQALQNKRFATPTKLAAQLNVAGGPPACNH